MTPFFKSFSLFAIGVFVAVLVFTKCAHASDVIPAGRPVAATAIFVCTQAGPIPQLVIASWADGTTVRIYSGHMHGLTDAGDAIKLAISARDYVPLVPDGCGSA